jgi:Tfp pilus assembly protein PilX
MDHPTTTRLPCKFRLHRQAGATVLFITLVLLVVMMLLGVTAAMLSGSQFQLAGNLQLENAAFNLAESATAAGQSQAISTQAAAGTAGDDVTLITRTWNDSNSVAVGGNDSERFVIEKVLPGKFPDPADTEIPPTTCFDVYRITARGASAKGTVKIIQSTVQVQVAC